MLFPGRVIDILKRSMYNRQESCRYGAMVTLLLPKQTTRVRFPLPASKEPDALKKVPAFLVRCKAVRAVFHRQSIYALSERRIREGLRIREGFF